MFSAPEPHDDEEDEDLPRTERLRRSKAKNAVRPTPTQDTASSLRSEAKEAVRAFFEQVFDPKSALQKQRKRMGKGCKDIDWTKVNANNILYISSKFDLLEWWMNDDDGKHRHKEVFWVVPPIIALPSHNGFQERIFSTCTWFDDPLRQSLGHARFEMAVLLAVNTNLIQCEVPSEEKVREIVKKVVQKFKDNELFETTSDIGFDEDLIDSLSE